jgi:hypothetical protein
LSVDAGVVTGSGVVAGARIGRNGRGFLETPAEQESSEE